MLKSVETRFLSRHAVTERVMHHKKVYKALAKDVLFLTWLRKQPNPIRQEVHTCDVSTYLIHTCDSSVYFLVILQYTCFTNFLCHVCLQCSVILHLKCLVWQWVLKVVFLSCSVQSWEHNWSIEDWIHSKRRNRLGQDLVDTSSTLTPIWSWNIVWRSRRSVNSPGTLRWWLKSLYQTTRKSPPTVSYQFDWNKWFFNRFLNLLDNSM